MKYGRASKKFVERDDVDVYMSLENVPKYQKNEPGHFFTFAF